MSNKERSPERRSIPESVRKSEGLWIKTKEAEAFVSTSPVGITVDTESKEPQLHIPIHPKFPQRLGFIEGKFHIEPSDSSEDPDFLSGDVTESSFDKYKKNEPQRATPLASSGVVLTLKGEQKPWILIGIRSHLNGAYSRQLTLAPVGGFMDVKRDQAGLIPALDDQLIDDTFLREGEEEIGLDERKVAKGDLKKTAFLKDLIKPHQEFGLLVKVGQTVGELEERASQNKSEDDFRERFVEAEDPLAVIEKIATEGDPTPPTHLLVGLTAGYHIAQDHYFFTESQAREWLKRMETGAKENAERNDRLVQTYWSERPLTSKFGRWRPDKDGAFTDAIIHTPNTKSYDPDYPNTQQGFATEFEVLYRLGLIKEKVEEPLPEPTFAVNADFNGVVLNPHTKEMEQTSIAENIVTLLQQGAIFGGNTGRAAEHAETEVLDKIEANLRERGISRKYLDRVFVVCEKGGVIIHYEDGERQRFVRPDLAASEDFKKVKTQIDDLLGSDTQLSALNFNDKDKKTMVTLEKTKAPEKTDPDEWQQAFAQQQEKLVPRLEQLLKENGLYDTLKVDATTIATDIQTKEASKGHAAEIFHEYLLGILKKHGIERKNFEVRNIGDSASDFPSHTQMDKLGYRSTFYAVGGDNQLANVDTTEHEDKIIRGGVTNEDHYDQATARIFQEWAGESEKAETTPSEEKVIYSI